MEPTKRVIDKLIGLLGGKQKIMFEFSKPKRVSIHTWFMRSSIKVKELNEQKKVLKEVILDPFRTYKTENKVKYLYEEKLN